MNQNLDSIKEKFDKFDFFYAWQKYIQRRKATHKLEVNTCNIYNIKA